MELTKSNIKLYIDNMFQFGCPNKKAPSHNFRTKKMSRENPFLTQERGPSKISWGPCPTFGGLKLQEDPPTVLILLEDGALQIDLPKVVRYVGKGRLVGWSCFLGKILVDLKVG